MARKYQIFNAVTGETLTKKPDSRKEIENWFERNPFMQEVRQSKIDVHTVHLFVVDLQS